MNKLFLILSLSLSPILAHSKTTTVACDPRLPVQRIVKHVSIGDDVTVLAAGNPTTGYRWISKQGIPSIYRHPAQGKFGKMGIFEFAFEASQENSGKVLTFVYLRTWEKNVPPRSTCKVKVITN